MINQLLLLIHFPSIDKANWLISWCSSLITCWGCMGAFGKKQPLCKLNICCYYTREQHLQHSAFHLVMPQQRQEMSVVLSPPQRRWEMLLKMEFSLVLISPSAAASRLSRAFLHQFVYPACLPRCLPSTLLCTTCCKERIENVSQIKERDAQR